MTRADQRTRRGPDSGFTVIELAVTMAVFGVLLALTGAGWTNYAASQAHVTAANDVVSTLRNAQMRATAESTTYRVDVDATARVLTVLRYDGADYVERWTTRLDGRSVAVVQVGFTDKAGRSTSSAYFYPRGTASPGQIALSRDGGNRDRVITLEGLTGRVSTT